MAATPIFSTLLYHIHESMFSPLIVFFFTLSFCSLTIFIFSIYTKLTKNRINKTQQQLLKFQDNFLSEVDKKNLLEPEDEHITHQSDPTHLINSTLLEILPSESPKWAKLFADELSDDSNKIESVGDEERADKDKDRVKKKKRVKKKRPDSNSEEEEKKGSEVVNEKEKEKEKEELVCLYPFTTSSSATQRKIKNNYDELVKSHESNCLTLAQVGQFVNCLIDARNELQHKSKVIQRRFTITKALLLKAERSSFDRLRQQIYKLELEQKRLEEDAFVYNWLQQQLKLSPAYKKMLEIAAGMEMKAKSTELIENADSEFPDISFEELLEQEKKDSFWQKNGRQKMCSGLRI